MKFIVKHTNHILKEFTAEKQAIDFARAYAKENMHESIGIYNEQDKRINGFYHMKIL